MAEKVRLKGILAKIESTYKTDSAPVVGTDGIQIEENIWAELEIGYLEENLREDMAHVSMGRAGLATPEGRYAHLTVVVAMKGCATSIETSNKPEIGVLLRMAGFSETIVASTSATYSLISSGHESGTVWAYAGGNLYKIVGCRAQLSEISLVPSMIGRATFEIWGVLVVAITDVPLPVITYPQKAAGPPTVKSAGLTLNAVDPSDFSSFVFETRTELATLPRGNDADGHGGYEISDYNPHVRTVIDVPALATFNPYTLRSAGTLFAWDIGPVGPDAFNKYKISGPKGRIVDVPGSDSDGLAMYDISLRCQHTDEETADDAVSIAFT